MHLTCRMLTFRLQENSAGLCLRSGSRLSLRNECSLAPCVCVCRFITSRVLVNHTHRCVALLELFCVTKQQDVHFEKVRHASLSVQGT